MSVRKIFVMKGFGFLELLAVMIVIGLLVGLTVDYAKKGRRGEIMDKSYHAVLKGHFAQDLERKAGSSIFEAGLDSFLYRRNGHEHGFKLSGTKPFGSVEKLVEGNWVSILNNVSFLRFIYFDKNGRLILDDEAANKPGAIGRVKVNAMVHKGIEAPDFFISDGYRGIDLDGDKSNGVARLTEVKFVVNVN